MISRNMPHNYRPEILAALLQHGFAPLPGSDPSRVYGLLKRLYTFEIRGLRSRHKGRKKRLDREELERYRQDLLTLEERYAVLRIPPWHWVKR